MRILQINATYGVGSTGKIVRDISAKLLKEGHESFVMWATARKSDQNCTQLIRIGNTLDHKLHALAHRIDKKQGWHSKIATKIACNKIRKINPDVVHLHNLHSSYIHLPTLLKFLGKNNIPTLLTLHDCWFFTGGCPHYRNHNCSKWENGCVGCLPYKKAAMQTFAQKKQLFSQIKCLGLNGVSKWATSITENTLLDTAILTTHVYNWIDTDVFKPSQNAENVRKLYNIPPEHKIILGVAQGWGKKKGIDEFMEIAATLKDRATVVLVGDSTYISDKTNLLCIDYIKNPQDLIDLYSTADVLVNPSKVETFGLVTAEALACGTPVAAYNNSGTAEIVTNDCGILVENQNHEALIAAITDILDTAKAKYSTACRQRIIDCFDKDKQTDEYVKLYNTLLHKKS